MSGWRKLLAAMLADPDPRSYTYDDACRVLRQLGFELARNAGGSHRVWRRQCGADTATRTVTIGLVEKGHGTVKPVYIRAMLKTLASEGLLPEGGTSDDVDA